MEEFDAIYCPIEDVVVVIDPEDREDFDGKCPNCNEGGAIVVTVREKETL